ncbi:MAG TPA: hypothetical protein PKZ93_06950 [Spirochaetota bacterium]|nr:hypothetical protein [Spirochaetota bacterium]
MVQDLDKFFLKVLVNSLNTQQIEHLGKLFDSRFDLYEVSGFRKTVPIPRQTAAETLVYYCRDDYDIVRLFSIMLRYEGENFYNRPLVIWGRDEFFNLLKLHKWVYDPQLKNFFLDPFYEHEINFLKKIRILDLRSKVDIEGIIREITAISKKMSIKDLEWRIAMRLYDLDRKTGELIRNIIELLLARQDLQMFAGELFFCLKELAINSSKANYKILFEKYVTSREGITAERDYHKFLELFKQEIEEYGNSRLLDFAKRDDKYYIITFQSTKEAIEIWVTNDQSVSLIEKEQILKKISPEFIDDDNFVVDVENAEGAGLGLELVLNVLKTYTDEKNPLKVVFYPDFIKIGFELKRTDLLAKKKEKE